MRIRQIGIQNVLHFDEFQLDFGKTPSGLHIVYGPNEAGKSTILRVLVDLLFGGKIDDEFKDGYDSKSRIEGILEAARRQLSDEIAASEAVEFTDAEAGVDGAKAGGTKAEVGGLRADGKATGLGPEGTDQAVTELAIARKKKYSRLVLTDDTQAELPDDLVLSLLGGLDKERYTLLFGFNHDRLRLGGDSLLESGGHAGISLFEAGGGIQFLQALMGTLASRTDAILDPSFRANSKKALNAAWREYKELKTAARKNSLRGEDWHRLKNEIETRQAAIEKMKDEVERLEARSTQLERIGRTRHFVTERGELLERLQEMEGAVSLTPQFDHQIEQDVEGLERIDEQIREKASELAGARDSLDRIVVNQRVLDAAGQVSSLNQRIEQYSEALRRLPGLIQQIEVETARAQTMTRELAPSLDVKDVEQLRVPAADELELRQLAEEGLELSRELQQTQNDMEEVDADLKRLEEALRQLGHSPDLTGLRRTLEEVRSGDVEATVAQLTRDLAAKRQDAQRLLQGQTIWRGQLESLSHVAVPLLETVSRYTERFQEIEQQISDIKREMAKKRAELENLAAQMENLQLSGRVPVEADLSATRGHRDEGWKLVRLAWLNEGEADSLEDQIASYATDKTLPDAFEAAMVEADEVADWMRRESERSARLTEYQSQAERAESSLARLQEELAEAQRAYEQLNERWQAEWSQAEISPKSPAEMRGWMTDYYRPLLKDVGEIQAMETRLQEQAETRDELFSHLNRAYAEARRTASGSQDSVEAREARGAREADMGSQAVKTLRDLVSRCSAWVSDIDKSEARRGSLTEQYQSLKRKRDLQSVKEHQDKENLASVRKRWAAMLAKYSFLPSNAKVIGNYLDKLRELFALDREIGRTEAEHARYQDVCNSFEDAAVKLAKDVGASIEETGSYSVFVEQMVSLLTEAGQQAKQRDWLLEQVERLEREVQDIERNKEALAARVAEYQKTYGCHDHEGLRILVTRSREKKDLQQQIEDVETSLRRAGGNGLGVTELVTEVEKGPEVDTLETVIKQVQASMEEQKATLQREQQELWEEQRQFGEMNVDRADAADDIQKAEFQLAEVDRYWNEYLRLELARRLLERTIEEFREQNESTVIERASELFRTLTLGHYKELTVEYDGVDPVLEAITRDNVRRRVTQMSDGTRDQLYLALRLAFVEQHIDSTDPVPLIMDDILVHFDDERTSATLEVLGKLAEKTQILYFTHHQSIVEAANRLSGSGAGSTSGGATVASGSTSGGATVAVHELPGPAERMA